MKRRQFFYSFACLVGGVAVGCAANAATPSSEDSDLVGRWMKDWMETKALNGPLILSRFADPTYFLLKPISWKPGPKQPKYRPVEAPIGFVTDMASIPRVFWTILPPDGDYAYAAIIHDYLYWDQSRPRDEADSILKLAMEDLEVSRPKVTAIHTAVVAFGDAAWKENSRLKTAGEKRILKKVPNDPKIRWEEWKKRPDVF